MSVIRTFVGTFATKGAGFVLTFLVGVMISRTLLPEGKGQVDALVMWAGLLILLAYPSMEEPQLAHIGKKETAPGVFFVNGLIAAALFGGLVLGVYLAILRWAPHLLEYSDSETGELRTIDTRLLRALILVAPLVVAHRLLGGLLQGLRQMAAFNAGFLVLNGVLALGVLLLVVVGGGGVEGAVFAYVASMAAAGLTVIGLCLKQPLIRQGPLRPDLGRLRRLVADGLRLHGGVIAAFVILFSDQLVVNRYRGPGELGLYALAVSLTGQLRRLVLQPTKEVVGSRLPELMENPAYLATSLARTCRHLIVLTVVPGGCLALFGYPLLTLVYGPDFAASYAPLITLIPGSLFWGVAVILSYWLIGRNRFLTLTAVGVCVASVNLGLNLWLVPHHGMFAAALSSSLCYLGHMTVFLLMVRRDAGLPMRDFLVPRREDFVIYRDLWRKLRRKSGGGVGG